MRLLWCIAALLLLPAVLALPKTAPFEMTGSDNRANTKPGDGPLDIQGQVDLRNIQDVSESRQMLSLEATFRFFYKDERFKVKDDFLVKDKDYVIIPHHYIDEFWKPDVFIDQVKDIRKPKLLVEATSIRLYQDQTVVLSKRMNFDVSCRMNFRMFPFDKQVCHVIFHSFDMTTDDYTLKWLRHDNGTVDSHLNPDIALPQFRHTVDYDDNFDMEEYGEAKPGLVLIVTLKRIIGMHIGSAFAPTLLFVLTAYITLFIPPMGLVARSGVPAMVLLTLFTMWNGIRHNVPLVNYASWLDIWMEVCMCLVFVTFFEYCAYNGLVDEDNKKIYRKIANRMEVGVRIAIPGFLITFCSVFFFLVFYRVYEDDDIKAY